MCAARPATGAVARSVRFLVLAVVLALVACNSTSRPMSTGSRVELSRFTRSSNSIGLDLYGRARLTPGNVALAPFAISNALVMIWAGARGETGKQIQRVLHAEGAPRGALETAGQIARSLGDPGRKFTFRTASRLFIEKSHALDPTYFKHLESTAAATIEPLDFLDAPEPSRRHINDWMARQTENHIRDFVPPGGLTSSTAIVIANGVYFRGRWKARFSEAETAAAPFHMTRTETKDVPTMHLTAAFRAAWLDDVSVIELPYAPGELAMTLVVPQSLDGLANVEARLSLATLDAWTSALRSQEVEVFVPRFEISPRLRLKDSLKALGMPLAFEPSSADFTAIARSGIFVSELFHDVYVRVDETGTEASAGTWGSFDKAEPPTFQADRPFLFFIREVRSGLILFMGRVSDPTGT